MKTGEPRELLESEATKFPIVLCEICGQEMPTNSCGYWRIGDKGINAHIGCFEGEIDVFKITSVSAGRHYFDVDLSCLADMINEAPVGDGYTVTKERMHAGVFYTLPEFDGF